MSLDFNYSKCDDDLLTDEHYSRTCESVVFRMMFVGMREITQQNYSEVAMRFAMFDAATGTGNLRSILEWAEVVRPWVGLTTNVSTITDAEFWKRLRKNSVEESMRHARVVVNSRLESKGLV